MPDHLIHPGETLDMMAVKLAWLRRTYRSQRSDRVPGQDRAVRDVGEARDGQRSRAHGLRQIVVRRRLRCNPGFPAMTMDIDGNSFSQHVECRGGGLGRARRLRRPSWPCLAGEHRANRRKRWTPHPGPTGWGMRVAAAIHAVLPELALVAGIAPGQAKTKGTLRQITGESELRNFSRLSRPR